MEILPEAETTETDKATMASIDRRERERTPMFDTTWAECRNADPSIFMPEGSDHVRITREAKAVCSSCVLVETCLNYAIKNDEWGIWGGTTMKERNYLRRHPSRKQAYLDVLVTTGGRRDFVPVDDENTIALDK
jgi:hypothetical protein